MRLFVYVGMFFDCAPVGAVVSLFRRERWEWSCFSGESCTEWFCGVVLSLSWEAGFATVKWVLFLGGNMGVVCSS